LSLLAGQILNGIATGMLYALMGLGLSLITGILNIPNFAHGALFAVGAYLLVTAVNVLGNFWIGLVVAPVGVALLGLAIEYAGIRRLYAAGHDYQLLFTFGLSLILAGGRSASATSRLRSCAAAWTSASPSIRSTACS